MDHRDGTTVALAPDRGPKAKDLRVKIFADGADLEGIRAMLSEPHITGFTTNPTLMHKAGVKDYERFARDLIEMIPDRPISLEVFSDDFDEMAQQAEKIASWGKNVYVKIPVTNTSGEPSDDLLRRLASEGVQVNCTGLMTVAQVTWVAEAMGTETAGCVSVFAGRVADTGVDPLPLMTAAMDVLSAYPNLELIWASPRELLNVVQADSIGCHIITVTPDVLKKLPLMGKDLDQFSVETVQMFHGDALAAGYTI